MYAFLNNSVVTYIEDRPIPLENLYHANLLNRFVEINTVGVRVGWSYNPETKEFTEPEIGTYIPEINGIYVPSESDLVKTMLELNSQVQKSLTDVDLISIELQQAQTELDLASQNKGA